MTVLRTRLNGFQVRAFACDYDGTLATEGTVEPATLGALERLRERGCVLLLVTGRELHELRGVFPRLDLFHSVVAENGALLYDPADQAEELLSPPTSVKLVNALRRRNVSPLSVGRGIIATSLTHRAVVTKTIGELCPAFQVIRNRDSLMVLHGKVNKGTGLARAAQKLGIALENTLGVGDAENDIHFLARCGMAVAVSNALPVIKRSADAVTSAPASAGVRELVEVLLAH